MSTADEVLAFIDKYVDDILALTLKCNYLVRKNRTKVEWKQFPRPEEMYVQRNKMLRLTSATYKYPDGSKIHYTWDEENGIQWRKLER